MTYARLVGFLGMFFFWAIPSIAATVTTLAGNGLPGFADGPALSASFVFPAGVAYDPSTKRIYIADAGAQRIRMLSPNGVVSTIAGSGDMDASGLWVPGDYVEGLAATAKFNNPLALAIDKNGVIYVADNGNHCIRKIANGVVSTFAHFANPTGVAVDAAGDVYVADPTVGLSKVDPAGQVTLLKYGHSAVSVAIRNGVTGPTLYLADGKGLLVAAPGTAIVRYGYFQIDPSTAPAAIYDSFRHFEGYEQVGAPYAISAFGTNGFVYADVRGGRVSFVDNRLGRMEALAGGYTETNMAETAGLRDGASESSLLNMPFGVVATEAGAAVVADSGNRRLRLIRGVDTRDALVPSFGVLPTTDFAPQDYKIAYFGNSFVWYDNTWPKSIQGMIEAKLHNDPGLRRAHATVKVVPVWGIGYPTDGGLDDYMKQAGASWANMVVYEVNWTSVYYYAWQHGTKPDSDPVLHQPNVWREPFTNGLRKVKQYLDANHIPLLVVLQPVAEQISPIEIARYRLSLVDYAPNDATLRMLRATIAASGVHWLDLTPNFVNDLRSSNGYPLFGTQDPHFALRGRELTAEGVAKELARMQPWAHQ